MGRIRRAFIPNQRTADARQMLVNGHACVGLYAGLHGLAQKLAQILDAAEQLREHAVQFVLIGDGPERRALIADAERRRLHNVRFLESRPADEMPTLVASADFMLVTLSGDIPGAVPSKLYQAMASARPIILVATGEPAEIVMRHEAGLVVAPGDIDGLVRAVRQLSSDAALRRVLGENGRRAAVEYFDRTRILERFATYLESDSHRLTQRRREAPSAGAAQRPQNQGAPKNTPLRTALYPAVLVMRIRTRPDTSHAQYRPWVNAVTVRLSRTALVPASSSSIVSLRPPASQSTTYNAMR